MRNLIDYKLVDTKGTVIAQVKGYTWRGCSMRALKQASLFNQRKTVKLLSVTGVIDESTIKAE